MERNTLKLGNYVLGPVKDFSVFAGFSCLRKEDTDRDLDDFIRNDAEKHHAEMIAVTYGLKSTSHPDMVLGFATLQNDSIEIPKGKELPPVSQQYPYRAFPAVKIGRLGVRFDLQNQGFGSAILQMIKQLLVSDNRTGCRFITVDARRDKANKVNVIPFYEKNGFRQLSSRQKTSRYVPLYFDLMQL